MVEIVEHFPHGEPPSRVARTVRKLIRHTPDKYLVGLGKVVLTSSSALPSWRKKRVAGKGTPGSRYVLGTYHRAWNGRPARIEMYIDTIGRNYPGWVFRVPAIRDQLLGKVFFHELGHHLHATQRPELRDEEQVADEWGKRLLRSYVRRRFWYLKILYPVYALIRWLRRRSGAGESETENEGRSGKE